MSITDETRRQSYGTVLPITAVRKRIIITILNECGQLTAREIAIELLRRGIAPSEERNFTSPRLTELRADGKVYEAGKKVCQITGRLVTVWTAHKEV